MEFKKATIQPEGKDSIDVLFNPTKYGIDKANQIAESPILGLEAPILQFVNGATRTMSMELFFDTYEAQKDVREHTNKIYDLLQINQDKHVPPICTITWGSLTFRGVLDRVSGQFTLFLADGTPVRATLSVTFKEYIEVEVLVRARPTRSADHRKSVALRAGDTLEAIAGREYGDARLWRPIADANEIDNPRLLEPGRVVAIPALE